MSTAPWSLHLLSEVLSAFTVDSPTALRDVVSRVAEAVDAEITAIVRHGEFILCAGLTPDEQLPFLKLAATRPSTLELAGRTYHLHWAPLGPDDLFVAGRATEIYTLEERALLRGMGRSIQLSIKVLAAVQAKQEALKAERLAKEQAMREATTDHLTGLPNRRMLLRHLTRILNAAPQGFQDRPQDPSPESSPEGRCLAALFIDLDRFKQINDLHGHRAGDEVLRAVARHLSAVVAEEDAVGRISGDEFLMISVLPDRSGAGRLARSILQRLQQPLVFNGVELPLEASIGIALMEPRDSESMLLENADMAMYAAKQQGGARFVLYHRSMRERLEARHRLQEELRLGLAGNQIRAWFQPIVSAVHGCVVGFEALARWHHPERGVLAPDLFVPLAEQVGLLRDLDAAVLRDACRQVMGWSTARSGLVPRLSVNVSANSFADPQLNERIGSVLKQSGFPAGQLFLEITETTLMEDLPSACANIRAVSSMGIRLAIDDFGTGYSSLSYLKRFPVGILKVDRSFVDGLGKGAEDDVIVETVIKMACSLGLEVVAEGVETLEQVSLLRAYGCHYLQGYLCGRPADSTASEQLYGHSMAGVGLIEALPGASDSAALRHWPSP